MNDDPLEPIRVLYDPVEAEKVSRSVKERIGILRELEIQNQQTRRHR